jgi:hypothetical protein
VAKPTQRQLGRSSVIRVKAGIFSVTAWNRTPRGWRTEPQYITVIYLDDEPLATTDAPAPIVEERWRSAAVRPVFAGPLRTMISWEVWP